MDITTSYRIVGIVHRLGRLSDWLTAGPLRRSMRNRTSGVTWPSMPGAFVVGDRNGSVAVCTLASNKLMAPLAMLPGVAIAGRVYTANLGIEKVIAHVTDNLAIRFLVLCGRESPFFKVGQSLKSLGLNGITPESHIVGAQGHLPQLNNLQPSRIEHFRRQVEVIDCIGETDLGRLDTVVQELIARNPGRFGEAAPFLDQTGSMEAEGEFKILHPGGHREPLAYDANGFFVISLDRKVSEIRVHHYLPDNTPAHSMSGRNAEAILLGLLRHGLISQMSHAGYLGSELTKAETALRLNLKYEQDQPLLS
jgi:tetrahydromethanopterin S-methyltransferase subunit A